MQKINLLEMSFFHCNNVTLPNCHGLTKFCSQYYLIDEWCNCMTSNKINNFCPPDYVAIIIGAVVGGVIFICIISICIKMKFYPDENKKNQIKPMDYENWLKPINTRDLYKQIPPNVPETNFKNNMNESNV